MAELRQRAFELFEKMKPGQILVISEFAKKDPEKFVQYGKDYIDQGNNFEFNKNYTKYKRLAEIKPQ
jgi:hypothetical protein